MNEPGRDDGGSLGKRIVHGGLWLFALHSSEQIIGVLRMVVVARLLAPADLGVLGMSLLTISVAMAFTETGIEQAVIQRRNLTEMALKVAWTASILRGLLVFAVLFTTADLLAAFFREPAVAPVTRILSLTVLMNGLTSPSVILQKRGMEFNKFFTYQVSGLLCEVVVTITLALLWRSVWAMVAGQLTGALVRLAVSFRTGSWRPALALNGRELSSLLGYGKWLTFSSVLILLLVQGDDLFVGRVFGAAMLGFYQMAYKISNLPATGIAGVLANLLFPAYSSMQDDLARLGDLYLRAVRLTAALAFPALALLGSLALEVTSSFLGEKWLSIVPLLQVLVIYGAFRTLGATTGPVFMALGHPEIRTKIQVGQLLVMLVSIYPLSRAFGILGVAASVTIYALIFNSVAVWKATRLCNLHLSRIGRAVTLPFSAAMSSMVVIWYFRSFIYEEPGLKGLVAGAVAGGFVYVALMAIADRMEKGLYRTEVIRLLGSLRSAIKAA